MARWRRPTAKLPCGCVYFTDHEEWAELCPKDKADADAIHARAQLDYRRGPVLPKPLTPELPAVPRAAEVA